MRPSASSYIPACLSRKARTREETAALCLPRNRTWLRACRTTSSQTKSRACFVRKLYRCMAASPNKQSKKRRASFSLGWLLRRWLRFSFFLALSFVDFCDWVLFRATPCSFVRFQDPWTTSVRFPHRRPSSSGGGGRKIYDAYHTYLFSLVYTQTLRDRGCCFWCTVLVSIARSGIEGVSKAQALAWARFPIIII